MERKEYLVSQYIKHLSSISKEEVISSFIPIIEQLSVESLEKLIAVSNANIIPYHIANKNALIERLMAMETIEVDAYIEYDDWGDSTYEEELDNELVEFFINTIRLILYCYHNEQKELAFQLVKKLFSIVFVCEYYDEEIDYNNEDDEERNRYIKNYRIDYFDSKLGFVIKDEKIDEMYIEAVIHAKDITELNNLLLTRYDTYDFVDMIRRLDSSLLYPLGERTIKEHADTRFSRDIFYLFDVINDYNLYRKAVDCFFESDPRILTRFVDNFYDEQINSHNTEIEDIVYQKIMAIDKDDELFREHVYEPVVMDLLNIFPKEYFILKYHYLFSGDKAFIVLNALDDNIFYEHIRNDEKKWLLIASDLFIDDYDNVKYIVRALFKNDSENVVLEQGNKNYLKRVRFSEKKLISDLIKYVVDKGKDHTSKTYYRYYEFVNEIMRDTNNTIDLRTIVKEAYPGRSKLQEAFNE